MLEKLECLAEQSDLCGADLLEELAKITDSPKFQNRRISGCRVLCDLQKSIGAFDRFLACFLRKSGNIASSSSWSAFRKIFSPPSQPPRSVQSQSQLRPPSKDSPTCSNARPLPIGVPPARSFPTSSSRYPREINHLSAELASFLQLPSLPRSPSAGGRMDRCNALPADRSWGTPVRRAMQKRETNPVSMSNSNKMKPLTPL